MRQELDRLGAACEALHASLNMLSLQTGVDPLPPAQTEAPTVEPEAVSPVGAAIRVCAQYVEGSNQRLQAIMRDLAI